MDGKYINIMRPFVQKSNNYKILLNYLVFVKSKRAGVLESYREGHDLLWFQTIGYKAGQRKFVITEAFKNYKTRLNRTIQKKGRRAEVYTDTDHTNVNYNYMS